MTVPLRYAVTSQVMRGGVRGRGKDKGGGGGRGGTGDWSSEVNKLKRHSVSMTTTIIKYPNKQVMG